MPRVVNGHRRMHKYLRDWPDFPHGSIEESIEKEHENEKLSASWRLTFILTRDKKHSYRWAFKKMHNVFLNPNSNPLGSVNDFLKLYWTLYSNNLQVVKIIILKKNRKNKQNITFKFD